MSEKCPRCGYLFGLEKRGLTYSQKEVYIFLYDNFGKWMSPTEIGNVVGQRLRFGTGVTTRGSAWACPRLKKLLKLKLIKRNSKGQYRVYNRLNEASCE